MPGAIFGRQEERLAEVLGLQLDPELLVLLPQRQHAVDLLRVLDDGGKRRAAARAAGGATAERRVPAPKRPSRAPAPRLRAAGRRRRCDGAAPGGDERTAVAMAASRRPTGPCARINGNRRARNQANASGTAGSRVQRPPRSVAAHRALRQKSSTAKQHHRAAPSATCRDGTSTVYFSALKRSRCGRAPSSPRRFFLSASYSW